MPDGVTRRDATRSLIGLAATVVCGGGEAIIGAAQTPRATPSVPASAAPPGAWPQFRGSARLTGVSAATLPPTLKLTWSFEGGDIIESSPTISDGVVYVSLGNGTLAALDLGTGATRWKYSVGSNELVGESSPAIANGVVCFGDLAGMVHAVRVRDGSRLWTFKTGGEIRSSPVIVDGVMLVGSYDTHLYALDALSGRLRWKFQTEGQVHSTPAIQSGLAFIAGCDMRFRAIRIANGAEAYSIDSGAYTAGSPVVEADRAYFGTFNEEVLALDLAARKILWRYSEPTRRFPYYSSAALAGGRVFIGGRDKYVHALDARTGKPAWTFATRARVDSSPAVAGGRVYVGSSDGRLYVLDAATGRKLWEFEAGDAITGSPAIASGRVVIGAQNGVVYCFG